MSKRRTHGPAATPATGYWSPQARRAWKYSWLRNEIIAHEAASSVFRSEHNHPLDYVFLTAADARDGITWPTMDDLFPERIRGDK